MIVVRFLLLLILSLISSSVWSQLNWTVRTGGPTAQLYASNLQIATTNAAVGLLFQVAEPPSQVAEPYGTHTALSIVSNTGLVSNRWIGGQYNLNVNSFVEVNDGFLAITQCLSSSNFCLHRFNNAGETLWHSSLNQAWDYGYGSGALRANKEGESFVFVGGSISRRLLKFDTQGSLKWKAEWNSADDTFAGWPDGGAVRWRGTSGYSLTKLRSVDGAVAWVYEVGEGFQVRAVAPSASGNAWVFAEKRDWINGTYVASAKLDLLSVSGQRLRRLELPEASGYGPNAKLMPRSDGGACLQRTDEFKLACYDRSGNLLWTRQLTPNLLYEETQVLADDSVMSVYRDAETNSFSFEKYRARDGASSANATFSTPQNQLYPRRVVADVTGLTVIWSDRSASSLNQGRFWSSRLDLSGQTMFLVKMGEIGSALSSAPKCLQRATTGSSDGIKIPVWSSYGEPYFGDFISFAGLLRVDMLGSASLAQTASDSNCEIAADVDGSITSVEENAGAVVRRRNANGMLAWEVPLTGGGYNAGNYPSRTRKAADGGYFSTYGRFPFVKISETGTTTWTKGAIGAPAGFVERPDGVIALFEDNAVRFISANGDELLYTQLGSPTCSDKLISSGVLSDSSVWVATIGCDGVRLRSFAANGNEQWERTFSPLGTEVSVALRSATHFDGIGYFLAGCSSNGQINKAIIQKYFLDGSEAWRRTVQFDLNVGSCATALAARQDGSIVVAVSPSATPQSGIQSTSSLVMLDASGDEIWRARTSFGAPQVALSHVAIQQPNLLYLVGDEGQKGSTSSVVVSQIDLSRINPDRRIVFVSSPPPETTYGDSLSFIVQLQSRQGVIAMATEDTSVWLHADSYQFSWKGPRKCVIRSGDSTCVISGIQLGAVSNFIRFRAESDAALSGLSSDIAVRPAPVSLNVTRVTPLPIRTNELFRVRVSFSAIDVSDAVHFGSISVAGTSCSYAVDATPASFDCDLRLMGGPQTVQVNFLPARLAPFSSSSNHLAASTSLSVEISPGSLTVKSVRDPSEVAIVGDRIRLGMDFYDASGQSVIWTISSIAPQASHQGTNCRYTSSSPTQEFVSQGSNYLMRYCQFPISATGTQEISVSFAGDVNYLPFTTIVSFDAQRAAVLRGKVPQSYYAVSLCSTNAAMTCSGPVSSGDYFCVGPLGTNGRLYFVSSYATHVSIPRYRDFGPLDGVVTGVDFSSKPQYSCKLDLDGDGAPDSSRDALAILRAMIGFRGGAVSSLPSNACAKTASGDIESFVEYGFAPGNLSYDVDGDGVVSASTDGLLILRTMLGLEGTAVTEGAVSASATRKTWDQIRSYLAINCGW